MPDGCTDGRAFVLGSDSGGGVLVTQYSNGHIKSLLWKIFQNFIGRMGESN